MRSYVMTSNETALWKARNIKARDAVLFRAQRMADEFGETVTVSTDASEAVYVVLSQLRRAEAVTDAPQEIPMTHPKSFAEFNATPDKGPSYTDLARQVDALKADNAALLEHVRASAEVLCEGAGAGDCGSCMSCMARELVANAHPGTALLDEMERLKNTVKALNRRDGEIRQQAFLDLASELAEMEPAARDAANKRIIDRSES